METLNKIYINGKKKLNGKIKIDSAKNAMLPILAGAIMCKGEVVLNNVTYYKDINVMINILTSMGVNVKKNKHTLILNADCMHTFCVPEEDAKSLRASIFLLGPLLSKLKKARVTYPGGCAIGARPINIHIDGLKKLGAKIIDRHGMITANADKMQSGCVYLPFPSVGATENLIMASVFLKGTTTLIGVAKEPEVVDLCNFLNKCGAKIFGAGTDSITINGVECLFGTNYSPISDRIVTGTYLLAPLMCGGEVEFENVNINHIKPLLEFVKDNACKIWVNGDTIIVRSLGRPRGLGKVETMPYPFFPTDLQQPLSAYASICNGNTIIIENLFENRFNHLSELVKMGANVTIKDRTAVIEGVEELYGASVFAPDLRGGASLVLAGLAANGYTTISNIDLIDRGYYKIEEQFAQIGAEIKRIK